MDFFNIKPLRCTYQNLFIAFTDIFAYFLLLFSTSWKICVKEQWPKNHFFVKFLTNVMICDDRPKRGCNIFESLESWQIAESVKVTQIWICFKFLVNRSRASFSKHSKLNFWNQLHPKIAFVCCLLTQIVTWKPSIQFWHQVSKRFWKLWLKQFLFGKKFRRDQIISFTVLGFPNERECSGDEWLEPLIYGVGATIRIGQEVQCLPDAEFLKPYH